MAYFSEIDKNGIVLRVIVADQYFIDSGAVGDPANWIQTSYNTYAGVHTKGGTPLRKNFAGIGYTYDNARDMFIPPKPFASWILNEDKGQYEAPVAYPSDRKKYQWDEAGQKWVLS